MVVRKAGGPNISKKKNIEEAKRMAEKKKLMMKEEENEDEDMSKKESDDDDDMSGIEVGNDERDESEEEEESDEDDDDSLDEEEDTKKPSKSRDLGQSFADKSMNSKTPVKPSNKTPAKTLNKLTVQQNSQKKQIENKTSKTPKQQNVFQSKLEFSPSPKKSNDNLKTLALMKQSKAAGSAKRKAMEMEEDDDDDDDDDGDDDEEGEDDGEEEEEDDDKDEKEAPKLVKAVEPPAKKAKNDVPSIDLKASEKQRRKDRDIRSLFMRGFPDDTTEDEIKALSSHIISVRLPANKKKENVLVCKEDMLL
ncbi:nucleolin-like [Centruroides vittatus]|uniref:nucleolin-like n=1 Tax=Centruroides vittatus TaxID=120091 RepID=UPI00350FC79F